MRPPEVQIYSPNTNLTSHIDRTGYRGHKLRKSQTRLQYGCDRIATSSDDEMCYENNLVLLLVLSFRESMQQAGLPITTKYERVKVETSSFQDIKTTLLGGQG